MPSNSKETFTEFEPSAEEWVVKKLFYLKKTTKYQGEGEKYKKFSDIKENFLNLYHKIDFENDGITHEDIAVYNYQNPLLHGLWARYMSEWHKQDLNMDLVVTEKELRRYLHFKKNVILYSSERKFNKLSKKRYFERMAKIFEADLNKDKQIDIYEAKNFVIKQIQKSGMHPAVKTQSLPFVMDKNNDNKISNNEYKEIVFKIINSFDSDSDGKFSVTEERLFYSRYYKLNGQWKMRLNKFYKKLRKGAKNNQKNRPPIAR